MKEQAKDHAQSIIFNSWTFQKLTDREKNNISTLLERAIVYGNFSQRLAQYNQIYRAYLVGLGYKPIGWREHSEIYF